MKNRKEFQELNRMAYPILLHYLLTSLFEILDQAIVGHYSVRGFAVVGIAMDSLDQPGRFSVELWIKWTLWKHGSTSYRRVQVLRLPAKPSRPAP